MGLKKDRVLLQAIHLLLSTTMRSEAGIYGINVLHASWVKLCSISLASYRSITKELEKLSALLSEDQKALMLTTPPENARDVAVDVFSGIPGMNAPLHNALLECLP